MKLSEQARFEKKMTSYASWRRFFEHHNRTLLCDWVPVR